MPKKAKYKAPTKYFVIIFKFDGKFYDEPDRIMKEVSLDEAISKGMGLWKSHPNPCFLKIKNELNETVFTYDTK